MYTQKCVRGPWFTALHFWSIHNTVRPRPLSKTEQHPGTVLFLIAIHKGSVPVSVARGNDFIRSCGAQRSAARRQELIDFSLLWAPGSHANIELKAQGSLKHSPSLSRLFPSYIAPTVKSKDRRREMKDEEGWRTQDEERDKGKEGGSGKSAAPKSSRFPFFLSCHLSTFLNDSSHVRTPSSLSLPSASLFFSPSSTSL